MRALILYNPVSGRMPVGLFVRRAEQALRQLGWQVRVEASQSGHHATLLARQAADDNLDAVFMAGGDGTIGQVAAGLAGSQTIMGILPAGTSNVMAIDLGLRPYDWHRWWALEENALTLAESAILSVDVGVCNERPFLLWAGMGLDAMTVHKIEPRLRMEKFFSVPAYTTQTLWNAATWSGQNMRIEADGQIIEGHYQLAVVNNIRSYMGGLTILSPEAKMDDGKMDLWLFSGENLGDLLRHAYEMMTGRHLHSPNIQCVPFQRLRVESPQPFPLQTDGDPAGSASSAQFTILPGALRMFAPAQSLQLFQYATSAHKL